MGDGVEHGDGLGKLIEVLGAGEGPGHAVDDSEELDEAAGCGEQGDFEVREGRRRCTGGGDRLFEVMRLEGEDGAEVRAKEDSEGLRRAKAEESSSRSGGERGNVRWQLAVKGLESDRRLGPCELEHKVDHVLGECRLGCGWDDVDLGEDR
jgi:hypothetical protein